MHRPNTLLRRLAVASARGLMAMCALGAAAQAWATRRAQQRVSAVLARVGLLRLVDPSRAISAGLPDRQVGELRARSALPGTSAVEAEQMTAWSTSRAELTSGLGALPLVVLGVSEQPRGGD